MMQSFPAPVAPHGDWSPTWRVNGTRRSLMPGTRNGWPAGGPKSSGTASGTRTLRSPRSRENTAPGCRLCRVVHSKGAKNRLHIDLAPDDRDAEIERLVDMGARHVEVGKHDASWIVLADPEGNEFCVLTAAT